MTTTLTNEAGHGLPELPRPVAKMHYDSYTKVLWLQPAPYSYPPDGTYLHTADQVQQYAIDYAATLALSRGVPETGSWIAADDVYRHARTIDVALNGEDGAASRPALCDVVAQIASLARQHGPLADALAAPAAAGAQGEVPQRAEFDYVDIADRVQHATGKSVFPSTVKAILTAAGSITPQPAAADGGG